MSTNEGPYVQTNVHVPLGVTRSLAGQSSVPIVDTAVQTAWQNYSTAMVRRAYQSLDTGVFSRSNPPFNYGVAGRIPESIRSDAVSGGSPVDVRILRGYIRRAAPDASDPTSHFRLYFMYNPGTIQRQYVSYLEQAALDPFNTILNAGNLVAPPGILDFSFELFFDRQIENANGTFPRGVLVDYDYFDLVVRGVVPDAQSPELPDSGVLMTNPKNITVVFSPQLAVTGRPDSASVIYEKFDHRMRPVRMRISLSIKAYSIGPVGQNFTFAVSNQEVKSRATIPYSTNKNQAQSFTADASVFDNVDLTDTKFISAVRVARSRGGSGGGGSTGQGLISAALTFLNQRYSTGPQRTSPDSDYKDCSGLIVASYKLATGRDLGATVSSTIFSLCAGQGLEIPFSQAKDIPGACLLMPEDPAQGIGNAGHIGFSDGQGGTVEATGTRVQRLPLNYQPWGSRACLLPGINYSTGSTFV